MKKKLLSLDDLYAFYSMKKKSVNFSSEKSGYNIAVQTNATFEVVDDSLSEGLLYGKIRAFHDLTNKNHSHIKTDVMEEKMMSIKDRPILADIIEKTDKDGSVFKDFNGHTMEYDEDNDKIIYIEHPVGHFVNPENTHLEYDEKYDRNFVCSDVVIYEEYTDTCEILRRRQTVDCSVELCIRDMAWDNNEKVLVLNDFYVQGATLLGEHVLPGMDGSKLTIKDFAEMNNSMFSHCEENNKLVETLEKLNNTLSGLYINKNQRKEEKVKMENEEVKVNEEVTTQKEVTETESTEDVVETVTENESEETVDETPEVIENESEEPVSEEVPGSGENKNFVKTYELSHEDIRYALYKLLEPYEEAANDWYWIVNVFDSYFVYQGMSGDYHGQKYNTSGNDTVAFEGEPYSLYVEFLTESERASLNEMRSNYSSIQTELATYKENEMIADKMTVFEDYTDYLENAEFKKLMESDNIKAFSKDELIEKADAIVGRISRQNKNFSASEKKENKPEMTFFAFSSSKTDTSFLDSLLNK